MGTEPALGTRMRIQLQSQDQRQLQTAQGYAELGMYLEANSALEEMSRDCRHLHDVLVLKLQIFRSLKNWDLVQATAVSLAKAGGGRGRLDQAVGSRTPMRPAPDRVLAYESSRAV